MTPYLVLAYLLRYGASEIPIYDDRAWARNQEVTDESEGFGILEYGVVVLIGSYKTSE